MEGGSAGEEIALEKGWKVTTLEDQAAALMEVASGTSDAAIIDLLMAGAMIGEGTSYPDLTYTDRLTEEEYGIGCRKGAPIWRSTSTACWAMPIRAEPCRSWPSSTASPRSCWSHNRRAPSPPERTVTSAISSRRVRWWWASRSSPPWTIRMKMASGSALTQTLPSWWRSVWVVEIQFVVIDWGQKLNELDSKAIDVVWNGMTLTDGVMSAMACTNAYCKNAQVVVVRGQ